MKKVTVQLCDNFYLDAGDVQHEYIDEQDWVIVTPPSQSMFNQVLNWLKGQPDPSWSSQNHWKLGIGATALCFQWGSWLAVLMDDTKPIDPRSKDSNGSLIADSEMKRINIEASANLAQIVKLGMKDEHCFWALLIKAYTYLPMPYRKVRRETSHGRMIISQFVTYDTEVELEGRGYEDVVKYPYRALANAMVLNAYRNGAVEDIHAGRCRSYSMLFRRLPVASARKVLKSTSERLGGMLSGVPPWQFAGWPNSVKWLRANPFLYPRGWVLTESSSTIRILEEIKH